jgi:sterol desaturase/sphingolipid hydroxylase (fatty acid hydroxylase superfamily)
MPWGRITLYFFALAFAAVALAETFLPFRSLSSSTPRRWFSNSILFVVSSTTVTFVYRLGGIALAFAVRAASHGSLNRSAIPYVVQFAIGFAALDLVAYVSHRLFHAFGFMWRVHEVHHSETDLDLATGLRFHPLEALFSQGLSLATIALLAPPPAAVGVVALASIAQDFFTHANLRVSDTADRILRLLIITPAMHRVHHSQAIPDQSANFGTVFSLWDRIFRSYHAGYSTPTAVPARCGLADLANGSEMNAARLLYIPFRRTSKPTS